MPLPRAIATLPDTSVSRRSARRSVVPDLVLPESSDERRPPRRARTSAATPRPLDSRPSLRTRARRAPPSPRAFHRGAGRDVPTRAMTSAFTLPTTAIDARSARASATRRERGQRGAEREAPRATRATHRDDECGRKRTHRNGTHRIDAAARRRAAPSRRRARGDDDDRGATRGRARDARRRRGRGAR